MMRLNLRILLMITAALMCQSVTANEIDIERANLAKLSQELDFLLERIEQIKISSSTNRESRYRFHYDILTNDLQKVQEGIQVYIQKSIDAGRELPPISGQYHEDKR